MNTGLDRHYREEVWENYAMGILSDQESEPLEEHLLICSACQDLLAAADEYLEVAKAALTLAARGDQSVRTRRRLSKSVAAAATFR
jgi:hypothetical protein